MARQLVLYEAEAAQLKAVCARLQRETNCAAVALVDRNGQTLAGSAETFRMDTDSLGSLVAGNVAATGGLAKLLGEREFQTLLHEGERDHVHMTLVGGNAVLVVVFDDRTTLGLVRLRVKKAIDDVARLLRMAEARSVSRPPGRMNEITEEDIDALFKDL